MSNNENLQLFEDQPIRTAWNEEEEEWYFSVVDVVWALTDQPDARHASTYWAVLKNCLKEEGASELLTNCKQLKLKASDGKRRSTDVANTEQLLRIIQSIPSKKAEPFKLWLAQVGRERIEETLDPELIADRLVSTYERAGYTQEWINQRLQAISARKELTDEWKSRGVQKGKEYAILTDELTRAWSGMTTRQYKNLKGLKKQSLRDNMSTTELTLNQLAEVATRELSQQERPDEYSAPERASRPDELSTMTAAVVQYIRSCCILCFCAFGAPGSARTRGLSLWVFQEGGRADAQGKRDATRRTSHQASHRRLCRFPALYHPPFRGTKHLYRNTLFILVSIQRRGDTAQSRRRCCLIPAESVLNSGGFGALTERYIQPEGFDANKRVAQAGGSVAGNARRDLEQRLGRPVITSANAAQLNHVVTQMIEASAATAADDETNTKE